MKHNMQEKYDNSRRFLTNMPLLRRHKKVVGADQECRP